MFDGQGWRPSLLDRAGHVLSELDVCPDRSYFDTLERTSLVSGAAVSGVAVRFVDLSTFRCNKIRGCRIQDQYASVGREMVPGGSTRHTPLRGACWTWLRRSRSAIFAMLATHDLEIGH